MLLDQLQLERSHERGALVDTTGPCFASQILEALAGDAHLVVVSLRARDPLELSARAIALRSAAHDADPAAVVPRYAHRHVSEGELASRVSPHLTISFKRATSGPAPWAAAKVATFGRHGPQGRLMRRGVGDSAR
jgi:hypothetical protein